MYRSLAIGLALFAPPCAAQSCPQGTTLSYIEDRGDEKIVHCAKPLKGPEAALKMLRKSHLGRHIGDFLDARRVPVKIIDRNWAPGSGAAFDWTRKVILLPPSAAERDAVSLAVTIAHEGYHAMQSMERGMVACIEAEQDAFFMQFVVYVQMVAKGARPLAEGDPLAGDLRLIRDAVAKGSLAPVNDAIDREYGSRRKAVLQIGNWLRPLGRLVVGFTVRAADAMVDLTENFETLDQHRRHPAYWWDKTPVRRTGAEHELDVAWKEKWFKDHQYEEFAGF